MLKRLLSFTAALGLLLSADVSSAASLMIDDFENPTPAGVLLIGVNQPNGKPFQELGAPITIGNQRDVMVEVLGTPKANSAQVLIGHDDDLFDRGIFQFATASDPASVVTLQYDGEDVNTEELDNAHALQQLVLPDGGITINFLSVDAPVSGNLDVIIRLSSNGVQATYSGEVGETGDPSELYAPYLEFDVEDGFNFADVNSFEFVFNSAGQVDVDFVVDQIWTVVPEPSTWALGLLSLVGIAIARRVRR
ncbi:MAG: PEP-CTERM sorting domain-containing protein [Planctomycetia bacterium]|nr:PEP-CTERM sorting domain-containing protein [Planctomycetia bacterium]